MNKSALPRLRDALVFATTMAVAGVGGGLADAAGLVGGWLTGALTAVLLAGWAGLPLAMPTAMRSVALAFAGLTTGAMITPDVFSEAARLAATMGGLLLSTGAILATSYLVHRAVGRSAAPTAFYSSWPGNTLLAFAGAETSAADLDRVVLVQSVRLLLLVVALPLAISVHHAAAPPVLPAPDAALAVAVVLAAAGAWLARRWRVLGGEMFFAVAAVGLLSCSGLVRVSVPTAAISFFQVVVGAFIALALIRCRLTALRAALVPALAGAVTGAALTLAFAWGLAAAVGMSPAALALAYAPGGAEAMILLSAVFGVDPGFVGIHHTVRLILLTLAFPLIATHWRHS